jgi:four helix bundle protein
MRNQEPGTRNQVAGHRGFRNLRAWELSDELASLIFDIAAKLPEQHRWLANQMCPSAVSVPANIAEGYGRGSLRDCLRLLNIARGSLSELEYHVNSGIKEQLIAIDDQDDVLRLRDETSRVPFGLRQSLKARLPDSWDHSGDTLRIREERALYDAEEWQ